MNSRISQPVIFFDGVCNLCNFFINYVISKDKDNYFKFASLQSDYALSELGKEQTSRLDTIILKENGRTYDYADAVISIATHLSGPIKLLILLQVFPRPLRNFLYKLVSKNRYRLFGKADACLIPTQELMAKFIT